MSRETNQTESLTSTLNTCTSKLTLVIRWPHPKVYILSLSLYFFHHLENFETHLLAKKKYNNFPILEIRLHFFLENVDVVDVVFNLLSISLFVVRVDNRKSENFGEILDRDLLKTWKEHEDDDVIFGFIISFFWKTIKWYIVYNQSLVFFFKEIKNENEINCDMIQCFLPLHFLRCYIYIEV